MLTGLSGLSGLSGVAGDAFTPASLPGLALWLTGRTAQCYTDNGGTVPAIAGDAVAVEKSPVVSLPSATQTDPTKRPLTQTDGLQFDVVDDHQQFTAVTLTGDFTVYFVGTLVASVNFAPFGSSTGPACFLRFTDGNFYVVDDAAAAYGIFPFNTAGLKAFRFRRASGLLYLKATGEAETAGQAFVGNLTVDTIGQRPLNGNQNGSAAQRYLSQLMYNRDLSAGELAQMDAYLLSVDGVSP